MKFNPMFFDQTERLEKAIRKTGVNYAEAGAKWILDILGYANISSK